MAEGIADFSRLQGMTFNNFDETNASPKFWAIGPGFFSAFVNDQGNDSYIVNTVSAGPGYVLTVTAVNGSNITLGGRGTFEAVAHSAEGLLLKGSGTNYFFLSIPEYQIGTQIALSRGNESAPFGLEPPSTTEPCFAEGVLIRTTRGDIAVEDLKKGDIVITVSGAERPIKWIGQTVAHPGRHPRPHEVNPIRIKAGAFASGLPVRDLRVSPGHAIFVDGVLVPAGCLVNGATIMQQSVETIRYFHVELDSHDVLLAESLACESYLDDGNRASFSNSGEHVALHGRLDPKSWDEACAPIVAAGPQLEEVQHRLQARAEEMGWVRAGVADLAVVADGVRVSPVHVVGNRYWFAVPAAKEVGLQSSSSVLAQVMPGLTDRRTLGVAVSTVRIDGETLDLDSDAFGDGFYPTEHHGDDAWRWTGGAAMLTRTLDGPAMLEIAVRMVAPSWRRPVRELRLVANG
ncbi:Hint domain-containing protein [Hyphomicrobium sp. CS1BSMeth3]|uniref:Hint domain-containing protein n=1 Tax=Hyphomicrobium sp. CS1BSMeth3 TaxID=1892844 RepID=UPI0009318238|nr:Hint domain-containing protein [Hyphomicrobium sp. CS1BSMeth3]